MLDCALSNNFSSIPLFYVKHTCALYPLWHALRDWEKSVWECGTELARHSFAFFNCYRYARLAQDGMEALFVLNFSQHKRKNLAS